MKQLSYRPSAEDFVISQLSQNVNLTDWETRFIKSIKGYINRGGFLSDRQRQKLSDLWEKY